MKPKDPGSFSRIRASVSNISRAIICCWWGRGNSYSCLPQVCPGVPGWAWGEARSLFTPPPLSQLPLEERWDNLIGQRLTVTGPDVPGELGWSASRASCFIFHLCSHMPRAHTASWLHVGWIWACSAGSPFPPVLSMPRPEGAPAALVLVTD